MLQNQMHCHILVRQENKKHQTSKSCNVLRHLAPWLLSVEALKLHLCLFTIGIVYGPTQLNVAVMICNVCCMTNTKVKNISVLGI